MLASFRGAQGVAIRFGVAHKPAGGSNREILVGAKLIKRHFALRQGRLSKGGNPKKSTTNLRLKWQNEDSARSLIREEYEQATNKTN